jgi:dienelactone hydrolase
MRKWTLAALGAVLIVVGSLLAFFIQTSGGKVSVQDVRYPAEDGVVMSGLLYVPKGATAEHPAPAVLISHGLINTREMQSPFAIELSRRGYVVLAMDMSGHGFSGGVLGQNGAGGPAAFKYLQSRPFVDKANIGLEGHSLGGAPVIAAVRANPEGYKAMVLEGSSPALGGRRAPPMPGSAPPAPLRNLLVVFGQYDEFPTMWQSKKGSEVGKSAMMKGLFKTPADVVPGQLYGAIEDGSARMLINPAIDHPQEHFTKVGVGAAVDWFQRIMPAAQPMPTTNQVWLWKEFGTLIGFAGLVVLMLGVFKAVVALPAFANLAVEGQTENKRDGRWWIGALLTAAVPALLYYPLMEKGQKIFAAPFGWVGADKVVGKVFVEQVNNQLVVWALASGLIGLVLSLLLARKVKFNNRWPLAIAASVIAVAVGYLSLVLVDAIFKVDYRFWVLGLKPLDGRHMGLFLIYLPFFVAFFLMSMRGLAAGLPVKGESKFATLLWAGGASALGFVVMLALQYGVMNRTGLLWHDNALLTIVAMQFIPLLFVIGAIGAFTWKLTNSYVPGAVLCALFITWYVVGGTAIYPAARNPALTGSATPPAAAAPAAKG